MQDDESAKKSDSIIPPVLRKCIDSFIKGMPQTSLFETKKNYISLESSAVEIPVLVARCYETGLTS